MELQNGLYNRNVYWPRELESKCNAMICLRHRIVPTKHYRSKCELLHIDYGAYKMAMCGEIIECEWQDGIVKLITRIRDRMYPQWDVCFAIHIKGWLEDEVVIKTVWKNWHKDTHSTLDESKYVKEN